MPQLLYQDEEDDEPEEQDDSQQGSNFSSNSGSQEDIEESREKKQEANPIDSSEIDKETDKTPTAATGMKDIGDYTDISQSTQVTSGDHLKFLNSLGSSTLPNGSTSSAFGKRNLKRLGSRKKKSRMKSKRTNSGINQINEANES